MTTDFTNAAEAARHGGSQPSEGLGPTVSERATVSLTLADLQDLAVIASRNDTHHAFQAVALEWCGKAHAEIQRLRAELAAEKKWGELWYFVSDEAPMEFEKIVSEWTPSRWIDQAYKLMAAKRGA